MTNYEWKKEMARLDFEEEVCEEDDYRKDVCPRERWDVVELIRERR